MVRPISQGPHMGVIPTDSLICAGSWCVQVGRWDFRWAGCATGQVLAGLLLNFVGVFQRLARCRVQSLVLSADSGAECRGGHWCRVQSLVLSSDSGDIIFRHGERWACPSSQQGNRPYNHNQVNFIPGMRGWFNIHKSINVIHHINRTNDKNHNAEKAFDKIQCPFVLKTINKLGIVGTYFKIIKATYDKPIAKSYWMGKSWKHSLWKPGQDKGALSHYSYSI